QAGRTQALAGKEVVGDGGSGNGVLVLEQQASLLEDALLAGGVHIHQHVAGGQDGGETIHRSQRRLTGGLAFGGRFTEKTIGIIEPGPFPRVEAAPDSSGALLIGCTSATILTTMKKAARGAAFREFRGALLQVHGARALVRVMVVILQPVLVAAD